jgi:hypothetical protein
VPGTEQEPRRQLVPDKNAQEQRPCFVPDKDAKEQGRQILPDKGASDNMEKKNIRHIEELGRGNGPCARGDPTWITRFTCRDALTSWDMDETKEIKKWDRDKSDT